MGIDAEMFLKTKEKLSARQILRLAYELAEAFGPGNFWIFKQDKEHCLRRISVYEQDGPDILPKEGEIFLQVRPATRYYGKEYERGDFPLIKSIAEWLELRIPNCEIFYGGDSSGVLAEPFGPMERQRLWNHFCKVGHRPYRGAFASLGSDFPVGKMICEFCTERMIQTGFGQRYAQFQCLGCNEATATSDGGQTWATPVKD